MEAVILLRKYKVHTADRSLYKHWT